MNNMELVRRRRSVRTFDGNPLRPEDGENLLRFAESIETPYGIPVPEATEYIATLTAEK